MIESLEAERDGLRKRVAELEGVVADEREACARIAETDRRNVLAVKYGREPDFHKVGQMIAGEIRARATLKGGTDGR